MRFTESPQAQIRAFAGAVKESFKYGKFSSLNDAVNLTEDGEIVILLSGGYGALRSGSYRETMDGGLSIALMATMV